MVVTTSAINCLERLLSEVTCYSQSGTLIHTLSVCKSGPGIVRIGLATFLGWRCLKKHT